MSSAIRFLLKVVLLPVTSRGSDRTLPMRFDLRQEGPAKACGATCRRFVFASGAITADTPKDFKTFARDRDLTGAVVVLDSDGGSVHGAIALGREIRRLGLDTTVGRLADLGAQNICKYGIGSETANTFTSECYALDIQNPQ